jgi:hypothetical protein
LVLYVQHNTYIKCAYMHMLSVLYCTYIHAALHYHYRAQVSNLGFFQQLSFRALSATRLLHMYMRTVLAQETDDLRYKVHSIESTCLWGNLLAMLEMLMRSLNCALLYTV